MTKEEYERYWKNPDAMAWEVINEDCIRGYLLPNYELKEESSRDLYSLKPEQLKYWKPIKQWNKKDKERITSILEKLNNEQIGEFYKNSLKKTLDKKINFSKA